MKHQNEQQKLKGLVRELERELSQEKSQVNVLEETQENVFDKPRASASELANENRGLREEIADWKGRFVASEENQRQNALSSSRRCKPNMRRVIDSNREMQEKLIFHSEPGRDSVAGRECKCRSDGSATRNKHDPASSCRI